MYIIRYINLGFIWLQIGDVSTYFADMMNKMQKVYSKGNSMDLWTIYCPKKGRSAY
jgi:hypothetical protein